MENSLLLAIFFSIGFFFESIFGFGGGLISYFFLGFFIDIKEMIIAGLYVGTFSSIYISYTSRKYLNFKILLNLLPIAVIGSLIGIYSFNVFSEKLLSLIFAILLFFLSLKNFILKNNKSYKSFKSILLVIGSISQGIFGIGGPFVVNAIKDELANKHILRANMAYYFLICNLVRIFQLIISKNLPINFILDISWIIIPVFFLIFLGYIIHMKINEKYFKIGINSITFIASLNFFYKAFF